MKNLHNIDLPLFITTYANNPHKDTETIHLFDHVKVGPTPVLALHNL